MKLLLIICAFAIGDVTPTEKRIAGGKEAKIEDFPYQVLIMASSLNKHQPCGGAIIGHKKILTAAHCIEGAHHNEIAVYAGKTKITWESGLNASKVYIHKDYDVNNPYKNDIGIICLGKPLEFTDSIKSIQLGESYIRQGTKAKISGWGGRQRVNLSRYLYSTTVELRSGAFCRKNVPKYENTMLCSISNESGACWGDDGGPAVIRDKMYAITLHNFESCRTGKKSKTLYENVRHHMEFINAHSC